MIGYLIGPSPGPSAPGLAAFHKGLRETGYVEGQGVAIEYRWAAGLYDRLPALAAMAPRHEADEVSRRLADGFARGIDTGWRQTPKPEPPS